MKTKKIQLNDHIAHAWPILIYLVMSIALVLYLNYRNGSGYSINFIIMGLLIFLLFAIPLTILHFDYYTLNRDDAIQFKSQGFTYIHEGVLFDVNCHDVSMIETFKSYPLSENRVHWFPWDSYHYSIITLVNGQSLVITSLLSPQIGLIADLGSKETVFKTFYPLTKGSIKAYL